MAHIYELKIDNSGQHVELYPVGSTDKSASVMERWRQANTPLRLVNEADKLWQAIRR